MKYSRLFHQKLTLKKISSRSVILGITTRTLWRNKNNNRQKCLLGELQYLTRIYSECHRFEKLNYHKISPTKVKKFHLCRRKQTFYFFYFCFSITSLYKVIKTISYRRISTLRRLSSHCIFLAKPKTMSALLGEKNPVSYKIPTRHCTHISK